MLRQSLVLFIIVAIATGSISLATNVPANTQAGLNQVTISTTYSSTSVTTTSTTTSSSTTSTSFSTSQTSTTTTTTSTYTSFSYTSSTSVTVTDTSTSTSVTGTKTSTTTSTTSSTTLGTSSTTSTSTYASTTTVAVFPGCLIATATFGSELAPEVQLLRDFRDNAILKTAAGSGFVVAFNSWYYSFSPGVAGYLYTHPTERTIVKLVLYPLVGILKLSSLTFSATSAFPEFAALLSGLMASSLIGAFYLGLPLTLIRSKVRRLRGRGAEMERGLACGLLASVAVLLVGEILAEPLVMTWSTVAVVLSALFLSALVASARLSRKLQTL